MGPPPTETVHKDLCWKWAPNILLGIRTLQRPGPVWNQEGTYVLIQTRETGSLVPAPWATPCVELKRFPSLMWTVGDTGCAVQ